MRCVERGVLRGMLRGCVEKDALRKYVEWGVVGSVERVCDT